MKERDYGFKGPPFDVDSLDYEMRGRSNEWRKIKELVERSLKGSGSKTILILGDYGYGKTFTLEKIVRGFAEHEFKGPKKSIFASIRLAESEPEARIGLSLVSKIFYEIGYKKLVEIAKKIDDKKLKKLDFTAKKILKALKEGNNNAFEWLVGESLSPTEKKKLGIKRILSKSSQAIKVLYEFQKSLKMAGYDNLVVLIDEFEYVVNVYSEKQVTTILHTFKEIYDEFIRVNTREPGIMANFIFIIAMTPRGWEYLTETEAKLGRTTGGGGITPWMERIRHEKYKVELGPLSQKDTELVIKDRIKRKRVDYKKFPYETFPFIHPEFFDVIYETSGGVPREVINYCDLVLDSAISEGLKEISGEDAKRILKKFNIS